MNNHVMTSLDVVQVFLSHDNARFCNHRDVTGGQSLEKLHTFTTRDWRLKFLV